MLAATSIAAENPGAASSNDSIVAATYSFTLTENSGQAICEAFLERLQESTFHGPPFCGLPAATTVPGFQVLGLAPLSFEEAWKVYPQIMNFLGRERAALGEAPGPRYDEDGARAQYGQGLLALGYKEKVDVENNGHPLSVQVWEGLDEPFSSPYQCGEVLTYGRTFIDTGVQQTRLAFVMNGNGQLDQAGSIAVFSESGSQASRDKEHRPRSYQPYGGTVDLISYAGKIYLAVFQLQAEEHDEGRLVRPLELELDLLKKESHGTFPVCKYLMTQRLSSGN